MDRRRARDATCSIWARARAASRWPCAKAFPRARVDAVDIDAAALEVAAHQPAPPASNTPRAAHRIRPFRGAFGQVLRYHREQSALCGAREMRGLPREYGHEPRLALAVRSRRSRFGRDHPASRRAAFCGRRDCSWSKSATPSACWRRAFPKLPFTWLDFERGGGGVFLLTREQLEKAQSLICRVTR